MCFENETEVTEIYLLGFQSLHNLGPLLFVVLLLLYIAIAGGNLSIIYLVMTCDNLKIPMFFFLKHLATADVLVTTSVVPMMLEDILKSNPSISVGGCITQLFFFCIFGFVQCFLLAVMSYDRYVDLSNPFQYIVIMNPSFCFLLAFGSWALIFSIAFSEFALIGQFEFCGCSSLDQFFCDYSQVMELPTSDTTIVLWMDFFVSIFIFSFPLTFILVSYIYIFIAIIKIRSHTGRQKTFSTCSSHLTTVCIYYGTFITIYLVPSDKSLSDLDKYRSLMYTVVTPLINPVVYSLRNHEFKKVLTKRIKQFFIRKF
ncbi:olfactory receptor 5P55-like [Pyxicephalus adspersus]|uniref:G-protein coupled receptors family 1 profile domain-containing protein n=1 Tax=Pyxicephalus adspersus TaxID=30357 RepID=A0AAV3AQJ0_PYXAD|nr:TPA: hypothetical protein GDO54_005854 [Pyxicephalus adspersus]